MNRFSADSVSLAPRVRVCCSVNLRLIACLLAALPLPAQNLNAVFAKMDSTAKGFSGITADVRQTAHTAVVNDDSTENGTIRLKHSKNETKILVDFTSPDAKTVSITGSEANVYLPKAKTVQVYDIRSKKSLVDQFMLLGFGANSTELKATYDATYVSQEAIAGQPAGHIRLIPKSAEALKSLKSAELWISDAQGVPVQQKFTTTANGDYTLMQYSNIKVNPVISDKDLKLTLPKGVHVQPQIGK